MNRATANAEAVAAVVNAVQAITIGEHKTPTISEIKLRRVESVAATALPGSGLLGRAGFFTAEETPVPAPSLAFRIISAGERPVATGLAATGFAGDSTGFFAGAAAGPPPPPRIAAMISAGLLAAAVPVAGLDLAAATISDVLVGAALALAAANMSAVPEGAAGFSPGLSNDPSDAEESVGIGGDPSGCSTLAGVAPLRILDRMSFVVGFGSVIQLYQHRFSDKESLNADISSALCLICITIRQASENSHRTQSIAIFL